MDNIEKATPTFVKITERPSVYRHLEKKSTIEILTEINDEDMRVAGAVKKVIPQILPLVDVIADRMQSGGRLFYIGAGTSGRLGVWTLRNVRPHMACLRVLL